MSSLKKIGLLLLMVLGVGSISFAQTIPSPMSPPRLVNDFTSLLSQQEQAQLEQKLRNYADTTSTQIYIVTVNSFDGQDKAAYAAMMGEQWKIGQKGKNNGILLLIKPTNNEGKGEVFIATGYGMEEKVTDAMSRRILEKQILPAFRSNQFYSGLDAATTTIIELSSGTYKGDKKGKEGGVFGGILFFGLLALMLFLASRRGGGGKTYSSTGSSLPFWLMAGAAGSSFGNFSSGGGSFGGGGFSGGGGGSFGGGGAGGSW